VIPNGVVVRDQFFMHLDLSLALIDRLRLDLSMPMALAQSGDVQAAGSTAVQGGRLGDMRFGLRSAFYGAPKDQFSLGGQVDLILPTGSQADFTGAGSTRGHLRVIASGFANDRVIYSAALGLLLASHRDLGIGGAALGDVGSSLTYSAGAAMLFADNKLQVGPELYGSTVLASGSTPLELLVGARYRWNAFVFGAGVGAGLTGAPGAATVRGLVNIAWEPQPEPPPAPVVVKECPAAPVAKVDESVSRDSDGDGIADKLDACQFVAGEQNADAKKNGCPLDSDSDGVADKVDACPGEPGLQANNGCPPPPDRDHDGVADSDDLCPDVAGSADVAKKGCPVESAALAEARINLAEQVQFEHEKAQLLPASEDVLRGVAKVMKDHPEVAKVAIEGFTDNRGPAAYNLQLSADRAASVLEWLVKNGGIDRKRLTSKGYGIEKPLASNDDDAGRQRNRRVEVRILEYKAK
jgi:outer membrane protein OmpA-like peptidoglycan-associated protein